MIFDLRSPAALATEHHRVEDAATALARVQAERWRRLDRRLPAVTIETGRLGLAVITPDGPLCAGFGTDYRYGPGRLDRSFQGEAGRALTVYLGEEPEPAALLLERLTASAPGGRAVLVWPSRDGDRAELPETGFAPEAVLAFRPAPRRWPRTLLPAGVRIRRAGPADLAVVLRCRLAELAFAAEHSRSRLFPDTPDLVGAELAAVLRAGDGIWLAERGNTVLGMVQGELTRVSGPTGSRRLPAGTHAYLACLYVRPEARGLGLGTALANGLLAEFTAAGARSHYLWYHPANPLSGPFWARLGFEPLWCRWERG